MIGGFIHPHCDIRRLLAEDIHHCATGAIEPDIRAVVADVDDDVSGNLFIIYLRERGNFAR